MGKTNVKRSEAMQQRISALPKREKMLQSALVKQQSGRVLSSEEKHSLKMAGKLGEIMRLWEVLRADSSEVQAIESTSTEPQEKRKATEQLRHDTVEQVLQLLEGEFADRAKTPRVSRVIQSCIKHGDEAQHEAILGHLAKSFGAYCTDAYAHYIVAALIRHASHGIIAKIFALLYPVMPQIISHKIGVVVVNAAYTSKMATSQERNLMVLSVLKDNLAIMKSWKGYPKLEDILRQEDSHRARIAEALFKIVDRLISQKEAHELPIVQRLASIYFQCGCKENVLELATSLEPHLAVCCSTREGSPLAAVAFTLLAPKARKVVLQSLAATEEGVLGLALGKHSAPFIARLFDLVYDGQILFKYLAKPIIDNMTDVVNSPYAHMVLMHLLTPEGERKRRMLLPSWTAEYNLFAIDNSQWNQHICYTAANKQETVEVCSKDAKYTHSLVLPPIVEAFLALVLPKKEQKAAAPEEGQENGQEEKEKAGLVKHHAKRICGELLHLHEAHVAGYSELLTPQQAALLKDTFSSKTARGEDSAAVEQETAEETAPKKRSRREKGSENTKVVEEEPTRKLPKKQRKAKV